MTPLAHHDYSMDVPTTPYYLYDDLFPGLRVASMPTDPVVPITWEVCSLFLIPMGGTFDSWDAHKTEEGLQ